MIPTIQDFSTQVIQDSYYKVYTTLLDIAVNKNCQILIGNLGTDYLFNYTGDTYNRLIYFYNDMYVGNGYYRPPYYVFLKGLLLGQNAWELNDKLINKGLNTFTLNKNLRSKAASIFSTRFVVAKRIPSKFSISSRIMF